MTSGIGQQSTTHATATRGASGESGMQSACKAHSRITPSAGYKITIKSSVLLHRCCAAIYTYGGKVRAQANPVLQAQGPEQHSRTLGSFRKFGATNFWCPFNKTYTILGAILGSPIFGNSPT